MAVQGGEDVYATLLLTDSYLPGALVLAHSLRDAGSTKKLAVLFTSDTVSSEVITQLMAVYDYVIPVPRIRNERPANLSLMNRPDLHSAFTKINLWRQTQFRKIVYLDADVVAYRAPDELFHLPYAFSAAPDIGWPDLFNTGVMVLTPNMGDYYALMAMAERGISFDGADQGLLNMHFQHTCHRLSFTYNVTPSAHYQYIPAYKHFQSSINMVHFIGTEKPWVQGRNRMTGSSSFDEMVGRWWAVYDRHYRTETASSSAEQPPPEIVQYFVKGEYQPKIRYVVPIGEPASHQSGSNHGQQYQAPALSQVELPQFHPYNPPKEHPLHHPLPQPQLQASPQHGYHGHHQLQPPHEQGHYHQHHHHEQGHSGSPAQPPNSSGPHPSVPSVASVFIQPSHETHTEAPKEQEHEHQSRAAHRPPSTQEHKSETQPPPPPIWDGSRHPPPSDSKGEALNLPLSHYEMSFNTAPFVPPERYPSPPKDMWYKVPTAPAARPSERPRPIFPWESNQPEPTRVFGRRDEPSPSVTGSSTAVSGEQRKASTESQHQADPSMTGSPSVEPMSEPQTPSTLTAQVSPSAPMDIWSSFPRTNAWDDVPEINRYIDAMQGPRRPRARARGSRGVAPPGELESSWWARGSRVTDFPSEDDRPSLPVTPAPIRRPRFPGGGGPGTGPDGVDDQLPAAEGVPGQAEWNPIAQLQKLAQEQSEALLQKLGGSSALGDDAFGREGREIPSRPLPYGSEGVKSPTYVTYAPPVVSPKPIKPTGQSPVGRILAAAPETSAALATTLATEERPPSVIPAPSYQGPGPMFEKGEDMPTHQTPALPTDEDRELFEA